MPLVPLCTKILLMQLYIIRHGQTVWNAAGKLQGRTDIELNQNGIDAAVALGRRLKDVHFDKIFSSPLKRAVHTAQLIRQGVCEGQALPLDSVPIETDGRLIEMSFGIGEGRLCDEWFAPQSPYRFFFTEPATNGSLRKALTGFSLPSQKNFHGLPRAKAFWMSWRAQRTLSKTRSSRFTARRNGL